MYACWKDARTPWRHYSTHLTSGHCCIFIISSSPSTTQLKQSLPGQVLSADGTFHTFNLATQTLPAIQTTHAHYPFQSSLTPPYDQIKESYSEQPSISRFSELDRSWSAPRGQRGSDEQIPMSQPPASGSHTTATAVENGPVSLPPLRHMSKSPTASLTDRRQGSLLGVQHILNPQADLVEQERNRRRSASQQLETPSPIESQPSQSLPSISRPMSVDSTQGDAVQARPFQPPTGRPSNRHLMSPRSPTVHRTSSISVLARPTGTIDAHASPFLSASSAGAGRVLGPDPTSQPALPTPPGGGRSTGFYPPHMPPTVPTPPPGMSRMGFPQSGSASPNPNFSPYSQPASAASSQYEGPSHASSYPPASMQEQQQLAMAMERNDHNRMSMGSSNSGQSAIQIMTIKSQQGQHVRIPVEVHAASKVADEKRKRNAGASARFRARRKEKEREASQSISRLETQLREAIEDNEYYRSERDYFKSIVFQQPGAERHYARPPSPRLRRISVAPSNPASSTTGGGSPYSAYEDDTGDSDRNVRRRTSNYHPVQGQVSTSLNGAQTPGYPSSAFASVNAAPHHHASRPGSFDSRDERSMSLPQVHHHQQQQQQQQQQMMQQAHRPSLHDPFTGGEATRYDGRGWEPQRG
ncbi:unnamed protein product [Periconia digitata]|uniref:BZIP domain-containing protein n=1 Tax=Periconia digitata TaxID=1303443 RepID=A0A9W4XSP5_9PLEO|nr:unnamed protein product [Periconia digitata]